MITIPVELYSSKNSRQIFKLGNGRTILAKSSAAKQNEKDLNILLSLHRYAWFKMIEGQKYPLRIHFKIYRKTHRRWDYLNLAQGICDAMVMSGWLPDDDVNHLLPIFEPYEVDKHNPRVEIFIEKQ